MRVIDLLLNKKVIEEFFRSKESYLPNHLYERVRFAVPGFKESV